MDTDAVNACINAENLDEGYCFPARIDDVAILENAININPDGEKAYYYLGCLFYDRFGYDRAMNLWEKAIAINPEYGKAFRNLALVYFDKKEDFLSAKLCMETALK